MKLAPTTRIMDEHIFAKYRAGTALDSGALMQGQMRYIFMIAQSVDESEKRLWQPAPSKGLSIVLTEFVGGGPQMRRVEGWADRLSSVNGFGELKRFLVEISAALMRMVDAIDE